MPGDIIALKLLISTKKINQCVYVVKETDLHLCLFPLFLSVSSLCH